MGKKQKLRKLKQIESQKFQEVSSSPKSFGNKAFKKVIKNPLPMIIILVLIVAAIIIFMLPGQDKSKQVVASTPDNRQVEVNAKAKEEEKKMAKTASIETDKGNIKLVLYPRDAPLAASNFATLAQRGYYDSLNFHRVEPGFVVQGGDPNCKNDVNASTCGSGGQSAWGDKFKDELDPDTQSYKEGYKEGVLAMANSGPDTNGSQFFIMLADTPLPHSYTIFGKVMEGMDVVRSIVKGDKIKSIKVQ